MIRLFARQKLTLMRGNGILNAPIIIFLFSAKMQEFLVNYGWNISIWYLFPLAMMALWLTGLIEIKSGIMKEEGRMIIENTPQIQALFDKSNNP